MFSQPFRIYKTTEGSFTETTGSKFTASSTRFRLVLSGRSQSVFVGYLSQNLKPLLFTILNFHSLCLLCLFMKKKIPGIIVQKRKS